MLEERLLEHGALLLRGFHEPTVPEFEEFVTELSGVPLEYVERSSPRTRIAGRVYTATDYPADRGIFLHNEQSYNLRFPKRLYFLCLQAAAHAGETLLADARRVLQRLTPSLVEPFEERKYRLVRNYHPHVGLRWEDAFQTDDRAEVGAYCAANDISLEWRSHDRLRTWQVRETVAVHPDTGQRAWFNHATFFHLSMLGDELAEVLLDEFGEADLPNNTYYGDGGKIDPVTVDGLRDAYVADVVKVPWQRGDVLIVDNLLVSHGRAPYVAPRQVVVSLADTVAWEDVRA